jgi:hypothetical protein
VNLLGDNILVDTIKKNTESLIDASKEIGLEINIEKTKYMLLSRHQNVGQKRDIKTANRSFGNVSLFKYLRTTLTKKCISVEIKRRSKSGNACYIRSRIFNLLVYCLKKFRGLSPQANHTDRA